jgi:uncharacterized membrane protein
MNNVVHPYIVHFPAALILVSVTLFVVGSAFRERSWSAGVLHAARWNLWIGAAFALASIGSGFLDYIDARCDQAAIEATILHRRSGAITWWSSLFASIAVYRTRHRPPGGVLLAWLLLVALAAGTATLLGTKLTYERGLSVQGSWPADAASCFELERRTAG